MKVKGKVAIITGASSGIGLATAKLLSSKNTKLVLAARSKDKLEVLSKQLPDSIAITADMTKPREIKSMIQKTISHFGKIDILVNNAGQGYDAFMEQIDVEKFQYIFNLNLVGPIVAMQQVVPYMRKQGAGSIVNISSGLALMNLPGTSAYGGLKQALAHISITAREELKKDGIIISVVYPYITLTNFEENTIKAVKEEQKRNSNEHVADERFKPDSAEHIAEKILEAIDYGQPEVFAHEWMDRRAKKEN